MNAYLIVQGTVTDWDKFKAYTEVVPSLVADFGGHYIAMGRPELLEGDFDPKSTVISQFPNKQSIEEFWNSEQYQQAIKLRAGAGHFNVMIVEGVAQVSEE